MSSRIAAALLDDALARVVAEPTRAAIVRALAREQLCTCHLVELTGAGQTSVSNHLRVLRDAGVVASEQAGRYTYYRLVPQVLAGLAAEFADLAAAAEAVSSRRRPC